MIKFARYFLLIFITLLTMTGTCIVVNAYDEKAIVIPTKDTNPLRDVAWDNEGNIYVIAMRWDVDRPQIKAFTPDGKPKEDFRLTLFGLCCEPFPLKIVCGYDNFLYILLPSREGLFRGGDIQLIRTTTTGTHDKEFGVDGVLTFPPNFRLRDFDVSSDGRIWILNDRLELYTFNEKGECVLVRELKNIFPEEIKGGRLKHYFGINIFAFSENKLLIFGVLDITSIKYGDSRYFSSLELAYDGTLLDHKEWDIPWFPSRSREDSFHIPTSGKSFIRDFKDKGSVLGFPEGVQKEPNTNSLVITDWSVKDGFHFFNITSLELPKEIYLDYDLNDVFFLRNAERTIVFFPFEKSRNLLVQTYDDKGKTDKKFYLADYIS